MNNKLREQYCLERGGIKPSNIIEWYYIEWLEYKLTEALKQLENIGLSHQQILNEIESLLKQNNSNSLITITRNNV